MSRDVISLCNEIDGLCGLFDPAHPESLNPLPTKEQKQRIAQRAAQLSIEDFLTPDFPSMYAETKRLLGTLAAIDSLGMDLAFAPAHNLPELYRKVQTLSWLADAGDEAGIARFLEAMELAAADTLTHWPTAEQELQQNVTRETAGGWHPEYQALMDSIRRDVASLGNADAQRP